MKFGIAACVSASLLVFSNPAVAAEITVMAGDLPPMINQDGTGREAEIISAVLGHCGHSAVFKVQPFTRHWQSFEKGSGDAVATVPLGMPTAGTQTKTYINYQNGVSFLTSSEQQADTLSDLDGWNIVAFEGASNIIPGLDGATAGFKSYREMADQKTQSKLLYGKRVDGILGDGMLFAEFSRQLQEAGSSAGVDASQPLEFRAIFEPSPYVMSFRDPAIAADFDRCFGELEADGTIQEINTRWTDKYRDALEDNYMSF
ncbi:transporter substrate-binding domain-containing protein [Phaeobacter gallaeciensis]|uniref:transporter substrate-binding domain-containing protein n=1 Tax=Phaeobacter gallaeciensis TaxID=60890 RepID=UPI00237F9B86|nr:transporter substrate-binding domain-containing protein [Phaeobacter gallaeciensis]MDE4096192.1 transporter substrate-binding domain-containing protein [Phaeobacter gallaeciensis]MDE4105003.1 transporter substrate-binding domain-containing protein [Phaeobacter gallaeciensis]MDE4109459.1 transporter substrate-binding domain-containing protein [Phaeobacter gallaeciensis]MDE4113927.1 transporter substrate-binding domain-containing protein [Phaeobacter gallaeciensis]